MEDEPGFLESISLIDPLWSTAEGSRLMRCSFSVAIPVGDAMVSDLGGDDAAKRAMAPFMLDAFQDQLDAARVELERMEE